MFCVDPSGTQPGLGAWLLPSRFGGGRSGARTVRIGTLAPLYCFPGWMPPIKDRFTIHSRAVVCQDVDLKGDITIGSGTIVHPKATIFAIAGPIVIGANCIIEESVILVNRKKETMRIGDDNLFEIGCRVEAPTIGNFNTVSTKARIHHTARLSSHCVIGPGTLLVPEEDEVLEDYTVVYGGGAERRVWSGRGQIQEADLRRKHAEYLREMLPKFNRLRSGEVGLPAVR